MGAFFLYKQNSATDLDAVREVFTNKGFSQPSIFNLGTMELWLYRKQLVETDNFLIDEDGNGIFVTGTLVYKGKSNKSSMENLLKDYKCDEIAFDELLGNFFVIFSKNEKLGLLSDRLCVHHIFIDKDQTRLSSSFLALLVSSKNKHKINRMACYEKFSTGYIVGPDTYVQDIHQITPINQTKIKSDTFQFISHGIPNHEKNFESNEFSNAIENQLETLKKYYLRVKPLISEYGGDLGLSSGYDSRLLLALANDAGIKLDLHTHNTIGVHDKEHSLVQKINEHVSLNLNVISTKKMQEQTLKDLERILFDGLYYFDARNSHNMGAFSETYTRSYKQKTLKDNKVSLNGLGGEIYRNYYYTSQPRVNFKSWMEFHVFYPFAKFAIQKDKIWNEVYEHIVRKMEIRLQTNLKKPVDKLTRRRYYSDIRMPDCDGNNHNAHNQLAFYLTPFMEYQVVQSAYKATPYIGSTGTFEAGMIKKLDPTLAALESHYGFPLSNEPLKHKIYGILRGYLPDNFWVRRNTYRIKYRNLGERNYNQYQRLLHFPIITKIEGILLDYFPEINWHMLMRANESMANSIYFGYFLLTFSDYLEP